MTKKQTPSRGNDGPKKSLGRLGPLYQRAMHGISTDYDGHIAMKALNPSGFRNSDLEGRGPDASDQHFMPSHDHDFHRRERALQYWRSIRNDDEFFQQIYQYYIGGGLQCIILSRLFNLLTTAFVIGFTTFLFGCIDHGRITSGKTLSDVIIPHCIARLNPLLVVTNLVFGALWMFEAFRFIRDLPSLVLIHDVYTQLLSIPECDLVTVHWNTVVQKVTDLRNESLEVRQGKLPPFTAHVVVNRLMRKENYLIAMFNKDLLDLRIPLPRFLGSRGRNMLTQVMEWHLQLVVTDFVFEESEHGKETRVRADVLKVGNRKKLAEELKQRMWWMGLIHLVLSPFITVFLLVYFFFKYGEEFHKNPHQLSSRNYTRLAQWKFRTFNELTHNLQQRLNRSHPKATRFINQFPQRRVAILAKFVSFVSGSLALALGFLSIIDDDILLNFHISHGRTVLWYLGVFGMIWTASRAFIPDPHLVYDPDALLLDVVDDTYYLPSVWRTFGLHSNTVRQEFAALFEYRVVNFFHELVSVLSAPLILWISLPRCADDIIDFFRTFTMHVDGVGWVCSFSVFDFQNFDAARGLTAPPASMMAKHQSQLLPEQDAQKMEASIMEFKRNYPEWEPQDMEKSLYVQQLMERDAQNDQQRLQRKLKLAGYFNDIEPPAALYYSHNQDSTHMGTSPTAEQPPDIALQSDQPVVHFHNTTPNGSQYIPPELPASDDEGGEDVEDDRRPMFTEARPLTPPMSKSSSREAINFQGPAFLNHS